MSKVLEALMDAWTIGATHNKPPFEKLNEWRALIAAEQKPSLTARLLGTFLLAQDDKFWGIKTVRGGSCFVKSGYSGVCCTGFAVAIRDEHLKGFDVKVMGFDREVNPTAGVLDQCDGHDFAVLEGRYIIDPWICEVENICPQGVFDMTNPADQPLIRKLYGDPTKWVEVSQ